MGQLGDRPSAACHFPRGHAESGGEPLVDLTNPEAVEQVKKKIEEEKAKHEKDKLEFAEKKKKLEADVSTKRRQMAVVRDALRRAQEKAT